jgi:hypothetical protein
MRRNECHRCIYTDCPANITTQHTENWWRFKFGLGKRYVVMFKSSIYWYVLDSLNKGMIQACNRWGTICLDTLN